jgi:hypothetical protein
MLVLRRGRSIPFQIEVDDGRGVNGVVGQALAIPERDYMYVSYLI